MEQRSGSSSPRIWPTGGSRRSASRGTLRWHIRSPATPCACSTRSRRCARRRGPGPTRWAPSSTRSTVSMPSWPRDRRQTGSARPGTGGVRTSAPSNGPSSLACVGRRGAERPWPCPLVERRADQRAPPGINDARPAPLRMMNRFDPACGDVRSRIWAYLDDELAADQAASVRGHLDTCPDCRAVVAGERGFLERVARAGEEQAPAHLKSRVAAILDSAVATPERVIPISRRSTAWWPAVAVAAAAMVAIVLLALPRERPGDAAPGLAGAFLGDHAGHSLVLPSAHPFEPSGPEPPAPPRLAGAEFRGLSRCVVD